MYCLAIPRENVLPWWQVAAGWLKSALSAGGFTTRPAQLIARLLDEDDTLMVLLMQADGQPFGAFVVELPQGVDTVHVLALGLSPKKSPRGWMELVIAEVVKMAELTNRDFISCSGRIGWERRLKPYGFAWCDERGGYFRRANHERIAGRVEGEE